MEATQNKNPINQELLSTQVARIIKEMIFRGELSTGMRLTEIALAEKLGVSRVPVREALRDLEKYGLVHGSTGKGTHVTKLTNEDIHEIFSVRILLEGFALEECIRGDRERIAAQLQHQIDQMMSLLEDPDVDRYDVIEQDIQFDDTLCDLCGNQLIYELWEIIRSKIRLAFSINPFYDQVSLEEKTPVDQLIVDAVAAGNAPRAKELLKRHLKKAEASTLKIHKRANEKEVGIKQTRKSN